VRGHAEVPFRGRDAVLLVRRGVLEVAVDQPGGEVTIFVLHLKSRHTENGDDPNAAAQRGGEAEAVRDLVLRRFPDPATARFLVVGDCNDQPRSRPLQALLRRGRTVIATLLPATDGRGDSWTYYFRQAEEFARVDYVLVSPGLLPAVRDGRGEISDTPEIRLASDHRPVLVRLRREPDPAGEK
jgi:endonuclease/exonuclease/phosphatase family metal-dependent hydrolase